MKKIYICPNIKVKEICYSIPLAGSTKIETKPGSANGGDGNSAPGITKTDVTGDGSDMAKQGSLSFWFEDEY